MKIAPTQITGIECWVFDLDNTLYPASCRLFDQVDRRIGEYVQQLLNLDPVAARALQKQYFRDHRTTLNGLMLHHKIKPEDFLAFVHQIDLSPVVADARMSPEWLGQLLEARAQEQVGGAPRLGQQLPG